MSIFITCPSCQKQLRLPDSLLTQEVQCPTCSHHFDPDGKDVRPPSAEPGPLLAARPADDNPNLALADSLPAPAWRTDKRTEETATARLTNEGVQGRGYARVNFRRLIGGLSFLIFLTGILLVCFVSGGLLNPEYSYYGYSRPLNEPGHLIGFVCLGVGAVGFVVLWSLEKPPRP